MQMTAAYQARFWDKVKKLDNGCWEWQGAKNATNYGLVDARNPINSQLAHRVSWYIHNGEIPKGLHILHSCDNPPCVNPAHLRTGTQKDNANDMRARGRLAVGQQRKSAKMTPEKVQEMRWLSTYHGLSYHDLADRFSVSYRVARGICLGERWGHIETPEFVAFL